MPEFILFYQVPLPIAGFVEVNIQLRGFRLRTEQLTCSAAYTALEHLGHTGVPPKGCIWRKKQVTGEK